MIGLRNNKFEFQDDLAYMSHQSKRIEKSIFDRKKDWVNQNTKSWL